jgi:hypothetical protein
VGECVAQLVPDDTACIEDDGKTSEVSRCINGVCIGALLKPFYAEEDGKIDLDEFGAMHRDMDLLEDCQDACSRDVQCEMLGYDVSSTVCVLYGRARKKPPEGWVKMIEVRPNSQMYVKVPNEPPASISGLDFLLVLNGPIGVVVVFLVILGGIFITQRRAYLRTEDVDEEFLRAQKYAVDSPRKQAAVERLNRVTTKLAAQKSSKSLSQHEHDGQLQLEDHPLEQPRFPKYAGPREYMTPVRDDWSPHPSPKNAKNKPSPKAKAGGKKKKKTQISYDAGDALDF